MGSIREVAILVAFVLIVGSVVSLNGGYLTGDIIFHNVNFYSIPVDSKLMLENFTSTWDTTKTSSGSSNSTSVTLPLESNGEYDFTAYWGDGTSSIVTAHNSANKTHNYGTMGIYTINISGKLKGFRFANGGDRLKLINITNWGGLLLGNNGEYFRGADNLINITADDVNLSGTTNFRGVFWSAANFNGAIGNWDVGNVTSMDYVFNYAHKFNGNISGWDVSKVTNMEGMFLSASSFNQDIGSWDVGNVVDMDQLFYQATSFNQDIGSWDVGNVRETSRMFSEDYAFNQDLSSWRACQVRYKTNYDKRAPAWTNSSWKPKWENPCVVGFAVIGENYSVGENLTIVIEFNENVSVSGGNFVLGLEFDNGVKNASYVSGNGTRNLTFIYTIQEGDFVYDLNWISRNALILENGSVSAADDGKSAVLTLPFGVNSLAGVYDISIEIEEEDNSTDGGDSGNSTDGGGTTGGLTNETNGTTGGTSGSVTGGSGGGGSGSSGGSGSRGSSGGGGSGSAKIPPSSVVVVENKTNSNGFINKSNEVVEFLKSNRTEEIFKGEVDSGISWIGYIIFGIIVTGVAVALFVLVSKHIENKRKAREVAENLDSLRKKISHRYMLERKRNQRLHGRMRKKKTVKKTAARRK